MITAGLFIALVGGLMFVRGIQERDHHPTDMHLRITGVAVTGFGLMIILAGAVALTGVP